MQFQYISASIQVKESLEVSEKGTRSRLENVFEILNIKIIAEAKTRLRMS
jgi:hypothetical protein